MIYTFTIDTHFIINMVCHKVWIIGEYSDMQLFFSKQMSFTCGLRIFARQL